MDAAEKIIPIGRKRQQAKAKAPPLPALGGNLWTPAWLSRPSAYEALRGIEKALPLWQTIHSVNDPKYWPCTFSRARLAATIGSSVRTIQRHLVALEEIGLLFWLDRGATRLSRERRDNRPHARWALDPFKADVLGDGKTRGWAACEIDEVTEKPIEGTSRIEQQIILLAEHDGFSSQWVRRAIEDFHRFERKNRRLAALIREDAPFTLKKPRKQKRKRRK